MGKNTSEFLIKVEAIIAKVEISRSKRVAQGFFFHPEEQRMTKPRACA